jgi:hypothetical protein
MVMFIFRIPYHETKLLTISSALDIQNFVKKPETPKAIGLLESM